MQSDLKSARQKRRWTQTELAKRAGVDVATISRIEAAITTNPSSDTVEALEVALKVRRGTLVFGADAVAVAS